LRQASEIPRIFPDISELHSGERFAEAANRASKLLISWPFSRRQRGTPACIRLGVQLRNNPYSHGWIG
jgi:hypothetical protein